MEQRHHSTLIRPATVADIPAIQHIAEVTWPVTYGQILSSAQFSYMMDMMYNTQTLTQQINSRHHFFILLENSTPVGFIDLEKLNEIESKLHKIYLLPSCQGKGYGKQLLSFAIEEARHSGVSRLKLNVNRHNKAIGFYQRLGFAIEQTVDNPIGQGYYMNDYVMVKQL